MRTINNVSPAQAYYGGIVAAYLDSRYLRAPVSENQLDVIKENISHFCERQIDQSLYSYQEKENQKHQMKQSLEVYILGVKDELRAKGRLV